MRHHTAVIGFMVVALLGVASVGVGAGAATASARSSRVATPLAAFNYAANTGLSPLPQACGSTSPVYAAAAMYEAAQLGVTRIRCDLSWWTVQPTNATTYDWTTYDNAVDAAAHFGITILFTVAWTPPWARPSPLPKGVTDPSHAAPKKASDYVRFVDAALNRYSPVGKARVKSVTGSVTDWEIWNEPNIASGFTPDDPVAYGTLLASAAKSIHQIDPNAIVVSGGMAPANTTNGNWSPQDFLNKMAPTGALKLINAVGVHPYGFPSWPTEQINFNPLFSMVPLLHQAMVNNGVGNEKIWSTEDGWPTSPQSTQTVRTWDHNLQVGTEAYQATELPLTIATWFKLAYAGPFFIYDERDTCASNTSWLCKMGVERTDGSHKPAWTTVHTLLTNGASVAPLVSEQPVGDAVQAGQPYSFTAAASGVPAPSVQWQRSNNSGSSWSNVAGATSGTLTGTAAMGDDGALFHAMFSNSAGGATSANAQLTVSTGSVTPSVSIGDASVVRSTTGNTTMDFAVTLSQPAHTAVTVNYATTDGTAKGGSKAAGGVDYRSTSGTVTFKPNAKTGLTPVDSTITVTVYPQAASTKVATLQLGLSAPTGGYATKRASATGTIVNETSAGTGVAIAPNESVPLSASGVLHLDVPITLSAPLGSSLTLTYTATPGTATYSKKSGGGDYGGSTSGTITFTATNTEKELSIPIWPHANAAPTKAFTITIAISGPAGTAQITNATTTATIIGSA
ncbi:MAG TPA: Calx-beta domain-containing protein [Acidimicrobiia bacterium]|jgi:hypothetical protein